MLVLFLPSTASLIWSHPESFPECHGSRLASHLLSSIAWSFWSSSFYLLSAGITGVQYTLSFVKAGMGPWLVYTMQAFYQPCRFPSTRTFFLFVLFCNLLRAEDGSQGLFCVRQVYY